LLSFAFRFGVLLSLLVRSSQSIKGSKGVVSRTPPHQVVGGGAAVVFVLLLCITRRLKKVSGVFGRGSQRCGRVPWTAEHGGNEKAALFSPHTFTTGTPGIFFEMRKCAGKKLETKGGTLPQVKMRPQYEVRTFSEEE